MHSFYNFDYVMRLPIKNIARLIIGAYEKQKEDLAWELYVSRYPNMTEDTFISFEEFYNPREIKVEEKTKEEILKNVKEILDTFHESR